MLEASAGTGKTYTIAALAARYVASGVPLDKLLLVTFTRMATGELRERVRERLIDAERALGRHLAGAGLGDAAGAWESARFPGEDAEPEHQLVLGPLSFADLMLPAARTDEAWDMDETRRVGRWARRLWDPVLRHEQR